MQLLSTKRQAGNLRAPSAGGTKAATSARPRRPRNVVARLCAFVARPVGRHGRPFARRSNDSNFPLENRRIFTGIFYRFDCDGFFGENSGPGAAAPYSEKPPGGREIKPT